MTDPGALLDYLLATDRADAIERIEEALEEVRERSWVVESALRRALRESEKRRRGRK